MDFFEEVEADAFLYHVGVKYRSGRYPYGSGENPYQHDIDFVNRVKSLKKQGLTEIEIAKAEGYNSTTDFRKAYSNARNEYASWEHDRAKSMAGDGKTAVEIAVALGYPKSYESKIRYWLKSDTMARTTRARQTADILAKEVAQKKAIDVSAGVETEMGVSKQVLDNAIALAVEDGMVLRKIRIPNATNPGKYTTTNVLCDPDLPKDYIYKDKSRIQSVGEYHSVDGGQRWDHREYPASVDSSRIAIRYGDQGGLERDGVIELRPGVKDLNLGEAHYAQVRIMVDGTHYLKGMAMYSDDLPEGVDIRFNTNKKSGTDMKKVLKPIKDDPDHPFGAYIKANGQSHYIGDDGKEHLSAINKLKEEGDWDTMAKNLSSQFLSKQPMRLINQQLKLSYDDKIAEFDEINSLTNNAIKRKMLLSFADECDSAAVHMKAAAFPRQTTRVILPSTTIKEGECYIPTLENGETVYLIRYPHAGTFEIPKLVVNNKNAGAKKIFGNATDAIGIGLKTAEQLSGADFDGDTVIVIPDNPNINIRTRKPFQELVDFDPKTTYGSTSKVITNRKGEQEEVYYNNAGIRFKPMSEKQKQNEMGKISNLITDMTLRDPSDEELIRATKHSMVVIDAVKHHLDYKQSYRDNRIDQLVDKYQRHADDPTKSGGASTLISKHKQDVRVPERQGSGIIDRETGEKKYRESGRTYIDKKTGKEKMATTESKLVLETKDVRTLSTGTAQENAYADYCNKLKALANRARKEYINTPLPKKDPSAEKIYSKEVAELDAELTLAKLNKPKERRAQAIADSVIEAKKKAYPELALKENKDQLNKIRRYAIEDARAAVGAKGHKIEITDQQWKAIQAGAISGTKLTEILGYADSDKLKERAMPKTKTELSSSKVNQIKSMSNSGYTIAEIANRIGCSTSTVSKYVNAA